MLSQKFAIVLCVAAAAATVGCKDTKKNPGQGGPPPQAKGPPANQSPPKATVQPAAGTNTAPPVKAATKPATQPGVPTTAPPVAKQTPPPVKTAPTLKQPATKPAPPAAKAPPSPPPATAKTAPKTAPKAVVDPAQAERLKIAEQRRKEATARRKRAQEIHKLGRSDKAEDKAELRTLVNNPKAQVFERASAIRALGRKRQDAVVSDLKKIVAGKDRTLKTEAAIILYQWGEKGFALPELKKLRDSGVSLRRAFRTGHKSGIPTYDKNAMAFFKQALKAESTYVRLDAAVGLIAIGKPKLGVPVLRKVFTTEERFYLRMAGVNYLAQLKTLPPAKGLLELATKDKDERVAKRARQVLKIGARPSRATPSKGAAATPGKSIPPGTEAALGCRNSQGCKWSGRCTVSAGKCVATSAAECKASDGCKVSGMCTLKGAACLVGTTADCQQSKACSITGYCTLVGGKCSAASSADCKRSSLCKKNGACTARDGKCLKK